MLMQNFKTAADLGISDPELTGLIKVLGMLERGELTNADEFEKGDMLFNMGTQGRGCGTPACIGGWVALLNGENQRDYVNKYLRFPREEGISALYWNYPSYNTPVAQAATALRSYLTTGDPRWDLAVA